MSTAWSMLLALCKACIDRSKYCASPNLQSSLNVGNDDSSSDTSEPEFNMWCIDAVAGGDSAPVATRGLSNEEIDRLIKTDAQSEISKFRARQRLAPKSDPLIWWRDAAASGDFPHLCKLRKYLCVPATSASVERIFSHAVKTISDDRARLDQTYASQLIFFRIAWKAIEDFDRKYVPRYRQLI